MTDDDRSRHDFKNQLAIILGFTELLLDETPASDPRRRDLGEIFKAAGAALDLLERVYPAHPATPHGPHQLADRAADTLQPDVPVAIRPDCANRRP
jgi:hypothetical protein